MVAVQLISPGDDQDDVYRHIAVTTFQEISQPRVQEVPGTLVGVEEKGDGVLFGHFPQVSQEEGSEGLHRLQHQVYFVLVADLAGHVTGKIPSQGGEDLFVHKVGGHTADGHPPSQAQAALRQRASQEGGEPLGGIRGGLDLLPSLAVHLVPFGKGLERMPLRVELLRDAAHHGGHVVLGFVGVGSDSRKLLGNLAETAQEPSLAHATLPGHVDNEAAAGIINFPAQVAVEEVQLLLPPDEFFLLAAF